MVGCAETRRAALLLALVLAAPGCFTGHLLDAARRREHPIALREAWIDGDRLVLAWDAEITTDLGEPLGRAARAGAIPLARLDGPLAADAVPLERRDAAAPVAPGAARLAVDPPEAGAVACARATGEPVAVVSGGDGIAIRRDGAAAVLVLRTGGRCLGPVPLAGLAACTTAAWAWPLAVPALLLDAAIVPPLLLFAPAVITMGD